MRIVITTSLDASLGSIKEGFNRELFLKLNPPFPPVKLIRFDGCRRGDLVILELNFLLFKQKWESLITDDTDTNTEFSFTDVGLSLPFFLAKWKHHHVVFQKNGRTHIKDDICYTTGTRLADYLLYPVFLLQFLYRKPVYRQVFDR